MEVNQCFFNIQLSVGMHFYRKYPCLPGVFAVFQLKQYQMMICELFISTPFPEDFLVNLRYVCIVI